MSRLSLLALVPLVLATACIPRATNLTPVEQAVRLTTNPDAVKGCKPMGEVSASDRLNGGLIGQRTAEDNATRILQRNAAKAGANVVLLSTTTTNRSGSTRRGEGYACPG